MRLSPRSVIVGPIFGFILFAHVAVCDGNHAEEGEELLPLESFSHLTNENHEPTESPDPEPDKIPDHHVSLLETTNSLPIFLEEPKDAYVVKNRAAILICKAAHALKVFFKCNGAKNVQQAQFEFVDPHTGVRVVESEANITRNMVEEFFGKEQFKCECFAWTGTGQIKSQPAVIEVAYLKKQFESPPYSLNVEINQQTALRCIPPMGVPPPRIYWLKNGVPFDTSADSSLGGGILVSSDGHLLISEAGLQHAGNYSCVAENPAAKRISDVAVVNVYVNGAWSAWSNWIECRCPNSNIVSGKKRTRTCNNPMPMNGGQMCQGSNVQKTSDCLPCTPDIDGGWSTWSNWSTCGVDCRQWRRRSCTNPSVSGDGMPCQGRAKQFQTCCIETETAKFANNDDNKLTLFIGILVAFTVFTCVGGFLIQVFKRKGRDHSLYNMAASEFQASDFYATDHHEKKSLQEPAPNLTACYEYPFAGNSIAASARSEHHYDVPHLQSLTHCSENMSPSTSSCSRTIDSSNSGVHLKHKNDLESVSSGFTSDSTYDVATETVTLPAAYAISPALTELDRLFTTSATVTTTGNYIHLAACGVALSIPDNALSVKQEVFVSVLTDERYRPHFSDAYTQLSPIVSCSPTVHYNKPVVLKVPHCACLKQNCWEISVFVSKNASADWTKVATLGQETINTPIYTQLDADNIYFMSDHMSRIVLAGKSTPNMSAFKKLKLAIFATPLARLHADYNVRVYILEDAKFALHLVQNQERQLGGMLLDKPRAFLLQDNACNLCVSLCEISDGWRVKPGGNYQEIPFKHIWNATSNALHCAFTLEQCDVTKALKFKIAATQANSTHQQTFDIYGTRLTAHDKSLIVFDSPLRQADAVTALMFPDSPKSTLVTDRGVSTCDDIPFRLNRHVRKHLCQMLDPPNNNNSDWRMFAKALGVDRYINYFATKASPTEHILDLWECRNRQGNAITELVGIFRAMNRIDAVNLVEASLGPSWL